MYPRGNRPNEIPQGGKPNQGAGDRREKLLSQGEPPNRLLQYMQTAQSTGGAPYDEEYLRPYGPYEGVNRFLNNRLNERVPGSVMEYMIGPDRGYGTDGLGYSPRSRNGVLEMQRDQNYSTMERARSQGWDGESYGADGLPMTPGRVRQMQDDFARKYGQPMRLGGPEQPPFGTPEWDRYFQFMMDNPTDQNMRDLYGPEDQVAMDPQGRPIPLADPRHPRNQRQMAPAYPQMRR